MATKISINIFLTYNANSEMAVTYLNSNFTAFASADQDSWKDNSEFNTPLGSKDPTGLFAFRDYFMSDFGTNVNDNTTFFASTSLTTGAGNDYANRATRLPWITT